MNLVDIRKLAQQAYLKVLTDNQASWSPPPVEMRDKRWATILRETWPDHATVYLTASPSNRSDKIRWCKEQGCGFWANANQTAWYFERRDIAALFKLTYGGKSND